MEPRACGVCGTESTGHDARFCQACGAGLDTILLDLNESDQDSEKGRGAGSSRLQLLALAAVVAAAVALLVLLSGGDTNEDDEATNEGLQLPTGSGIVEARANAARTEPATTQPTVQSTTTSTPVAVDVVDVSALPEMGATHVAVQTGFVLQFLDLHSGVWTAVELSRRVREMEPVGAGVVLTDTESHVRYASVDGGDLLELSGPEGSYLLGVTEELVILGRFGLDPLVEARYVDGSLAWNAELPFSSWAIGSTPAGDIVIQVNEWVALFDPITTEASVLATGTSVGMFGELLLVNTCTAELDCGIDQVNITTGRTDRVLDGAAGWFAETNDPDQINFVAQDTSDVTKLRLIDGILTATDEGPVTFLGPDPNSATDTTTEITVAAVRDGIQFVNPAGELVAELPVPFPGMTSGALVALIGNDS